MVAKEAFVANEGVSTIVFALRVIGLVENSPMCPFRLIVQHDDRIASTRTCMPVHSLFCTAVKES